MSFVFLHGFASSPRVFDAWCRRFDGVALEILGHGACSAAASFDEEVDRLLTEAPTRATWVGYSMGGRLALGAAARAPERVAQLVVIAAHPGLEDTQARAARRVEDEARALRLEREGLDAFFRTWDALPMFALRTPPSRDGLDAAGLARALRVLGTGAMPSLWESLGRVPLTYVVGARDAAYIALAARLRQGVPSARVVEVAEADHDVLGCGARARHLVAQLLEAS